MTLVIAEGFEHYTEDEMKFQDNKVWRFFAERNPASMTYDLYWMSEGINGETYQREFPEEISVKNDPNVIVQMPEPTFRLGYEEAQTLMDELWKSGLRPSKEPNFGQEEKKSMQSHIDTLKKVVDHFASMQKVEVEGDLADKIDTLEEMVMGGGTEKKPG